jgi:hypothetical protein
MTRQLVRTTASKLLRSDDLIADEKAVAAGILLADPTLGFPHAVRCDWCRETRTLFRDESDGPFKLTEHGWRCETCNTRAASQVIKF